MSMFYFFHLGHRRPKAFAKLRRLSESQKSLTDFNVSRPSFQPPPRPPFQKRVQRSVFSPKPPNFSTTFFEIFSRGEGQRRLNTWLTDRADETGPKGFHRSYKSHRPYRPHKAREAHKPYKPCGPYKVHAAAATPTGRRDRAKTSSSVQETMSPPPTAHR